jgi:hypothetical protein
MMVRALGRRRSGGEVSGNPMRDRRTILLEGHSVGASQRMGRAAAPRSGAATDSPARRVRHFAQVRDKFSVAPARPGAAATGLESQFKTQTRMASLYEHLQLPLPGRLP